ncbi:DUF2235 domain-containing protein [Pantoea eucalypti]|uniref:DUF2235 domain-containing protein n=1 Tax=Pantoea eucalypti TaxID=470933 RepID=UPI0024B8D88F|nr:DUF2235 domain-containing protein [Pantoea eucalypti]MDJ0474323.1 DUF2235 domain-containing protein [Pantoea eucalypti]
MDPLLNDVSAPCVIRIGVFFDGTGNNGHVYDERSDEAFLMTNVYRLYQHYGIAENEPSDIRTCKVYIEGIGTLNQHSDSIYSIATGDEDIFGRKGYGPDSKLNFCHQRISSELVKTLSENCLTGENISIEFDVFGFSRGAVLARHFINTVHEGDTVVMEVLHQAMNRSGHIMVGKPLINFMGLFDTVGTFVDSQVFKNDPHDTGYTRNLKVTVSADAVRKGFQLNAMHECRYNLSLHTLHGHYPELTVAGAHADVGGGYPETQSELKKVSEKWFFPFQWARTRVENELNNTLYSEKWFLLAGRISFRGFKHLYSFAINERVVKGHLQFITFLVMVAISEKCGCSFKSDYRKYEALIPVPLKVYHQHLMSAALSTLEGKPCQLDQSLINKLMPEYVHLSASWETIKDMYGDLRHNREMLSCREDGSGEVRNVIDLSVMNNYWPNRPDENWQRKIFS